MKGSESFKKRIQEHLEHKASSDSLFEKVYNKPNKNIDECINYILNEVYKSGCNGFDDTEIYSMAIHYYDEDNIVVEPNKSIQRVVVDHHVEITDEEKQEIKQQAINKAIEEEKKRITKKKTPVSNNDQVEALQQSLF